MEQRNDHGGEIGAAMRRFGGTRAEWLDLSTGINPNPFPIGDGDLAAFLHALPDPEGLHALEDAARSFWNVPDGADVLAAPGASSIIASIPGLVPAGSVQIAEPTYNEHRSAFQKNGWQFGDAAKAKVVVNPNNPDGRFFSTTDLDGAELAVVDESFCDIAPDQSLIANSNQPGWLVLKSFGKFWGLAGLRLGFAIGDPALIARLRDRLGPWPVSGPAIEIGVRALSDQKWATTTRKALDIKAERLDQTLRQAGHQPIGGTSLFRLYDTDAANLHERLGSAKILTRVFPYNARWIRLGLPGCEEDWARLEAAL